MRCLHEECTAGPKAKIPDHMKNLLPAINNLLCFLGDNAVIIFYRFCYDTIKSFMGNVSQQNSQVFSTKLISFPT